MKEYTFYVLLGHEEGVFQTFFFYEVCDFQQVENYEKLFKNTYGYCIPKILPTLNLKLLHFVRHIPIYFLCCNVAIQRK